MPFDTFSPDIRSFSATAAHAIRLNVRMPDGGWLAPPAESGARLSDVLAAFGVPIVQGSACRARVRGTAPCERLLSGIVISPDLDGLEIELDWDAIEPQHYWIAG